MPEIDWNPDNTRIISKLFAEQVGRGNRPNTCLNSVGYAEVVKGFKERTGIDATKLQLKNKCDKLKEDYKAWKKLKMRQTGTGWDRQKGTIDMDEDWWKRARADIPGCGKFKKLALQNEDELARCFGDITNLGADHWSPRGANIETAPGTNGDTSPVVGDTQEEPSNYEQGDAAFNLESQEILEEENVSTPSPASGKRPPRPVQGKGKKANTGNGLLIQEAVTSTASSANEYVSKKDGKFSIDQVMELVIACGAGYGTNEHYIASDLFVKKEQREMFMTLPTDEIRFNWLSRKYNDKYAK